jgi:hypothetical protein
LNINRDVDFAAMLIRRAGDWKTQLHLQKRIPLVLKAGTRTQNRTAICRMRTYRADRYTIRAKETYANCTYYFTLSQ